MKTAFLIQSLCGLIWTCGPVEMVAAQATGPSPDAPVRQEPSGAAVLPVNQVLTPAGKLVHLAGLRPQAIALSPDRRLLAVSGKSSELVILDPSDGSIRQRVALPPEDRSAETPLPPSANILQPDTKGQLSYTGLLFSDDGRWIYLSNVNGSIKVFAVAEDGRVRPSHSIRLPSANAPRRKAEIPAGLALAPDGRRLFVCGNLSNRLLEIDLQTGRVLRTFAVGVAPFDVVLVGTKASSATGGGAAPVQMISPARPAAALSSASIPSATLPAKGQSRSSISKQGQRSRQRKS